MFAAPGKFAGTLAATLLVVALSTTMAAPLPTVADEVPLVGADAAAVRIPSASGAWGGIRTGKEATLSDRVVDYRIQATLDPVKHTIDGREQLTWRNRSGQDIRAVYLHLYLNAFEGSGSTFFTEQRQPGFGFRSDEPTLDGGWGHIELSSVTQNGKPVKWTFVHPDGGPSTDHTVVRLDLPEPVQGGASTMLDIGFKDQLPRVLARTGYFGSFHLVAQWFPKIGVLELAGERGATAPRWNVHEMHLNSEFYADYGSYDVSLTVPEGYTVGATGEETGAPVRRGKMVTHRFVQGDVHDFAWTADKRTAKPLEGVYRAPGSPPVNVRVLFPPEYRASAAPSLKATLDSLKYFSETLGRYPYATVTVVIPPFNAEESGGMEYPTFFTADGHETVEPNTTKAYMLDFVNIHEFGHGYFYGLIGSNEFEEPILDEGLNEYWNLRMLRERGQKAVISSALLGRIGVAPTFGGFDAERLGASNNEPADALGANAWTRFSSGSYGTVYARTATMMGDLESHLGKATMERAFKEYYRRWHFRHPSTADLRDTIADVSGRRALVDSYFEQQVYNSHKVDDRVDKLTSVEQLPLPGTTQVKGKWLETSEDKADELADKQRATWKKAHGKAAKGTGPFPYLTTVTVRRAGANVPQTVLVRFADGSQRSVQWNDSRRWARFTWFTPSKAVSAELDPQRRNLLDASKLDDSRTLKPDRSASRRWASDVAALLQTLYSLLVTL